MSFADALHWESNQISSFDVCSLPQISSFAPPYAAEPLAVLKGHVGVVYSVALSANGDVVYSSAADDTIRVWGVSLRAVALVLSWCSWSEISALPPIRRVNIVRVSPTQSIFHLGPIPADLLGGKFPGAETGTAGVNLFP